MNFIEKFIFSSDKIQVFSKCMSKKKTVVGDDE
jgi:hypothetical protein